MVLPQIPTMIFLTYLAPESNHLPFKIKTKYDDPKGLIGEYLLNFRYGRYPGMEIAVLPNTSGPFPSTDIILFLSISREIDTYMRQRILQILSLCLMHSGCAHVLPPHGSRCPYDRCGSNDAGSALLQSHEMAAFDTHSSIRPRALKTKVGRYPSGAIFQPLL